MSRPAGSSGWQLGSPGRLASGPPPGATRVTPAPKLEYEARHPCSVVAPTAITLRARAGYAAEACASLPAAATTTTPRRLASRSAEVSSGVSDLGMPPG